MQYHDASMFGFRVPPDHNNEQSVLGKRDGGKSTTRLVTFYRNGDKDFEGLQLPVSRKSFTTWDSLLHYLDDTIHLPNGVRYVYTLDGQRVTDITQLVNDTAYVCASGKFLSGLQHGKSDNTGQVWQHVRPRFGANLPLLNTESNLRSELVNGKELRREGVNANLQPTIADSTITPTMAAMPAVEVRAKLKPRVITIISNTNRASRSRILLNPRTAQCFEEVLRDMSNSITMANAPIRQIYTWMTEKQVLSFNQLFNDYKEHETFIACGTEPLIKSSQLSSDSASEDMTPRIVDNRARDRVMFAVPNNPNSEDEKVIGFSNKSRSHKRGKKQDAQNETKTQRAYLRYPVSSDDGFSPRSSLDSSPLPLLPPLRPRKAFASSGSEDSVIGSPIAHRRVGRAKHSYAVEPMQVDPHDSSTSSSGTRDGRNNRQRHKLLQKRDTVEDMSSLSQSNSESATKSGDQYDGTQKKKSKGRFRGVGRPYRDLAAPITVEVHGKKKYFFPPSNVDPSDPSNGAPDKRLKLEWVYGYRGLDGRNNLFVLPSGELLYCVGGVAIVYDKETDQQRHYLGHNEDITSMAVHPSGSFVATGQLCGQLPQGTPPDMALCHSAHVRVWETNSLCTHAILGLDFFEVGIACLSFSSENNGEWLMAVDNSEDHTLSIWGWSDDNLIAKSNDYILYDTDLAEQETNVEDVLVGMFNPHDDHLIVTAGKQHLFFWKIKNKKIVRDKKSGIFESIKPDYVSCVTFSNTGDVIAGDSGGSITVWEKDNDQIYRMRYCVQHAHERFISSLCMLVDGTLLSGGGRDRRLIAWDSLHGYTSAKNEKMFTESAGGIRVIAPVTPNSTNSRIVLGTTMNHIMEGTLQTKFEYVLQGHCSELWALAAHPRELGFATAGYDQHVKFWRAEDHILLWKVNVEKPCLSCAFHPDGTVLAVGTIVGRFVVFSVEDGMHVTSVQVGHEHLGVVKYSPDGTLLAVASHDHNIYLFSVMDDGLVYRKYGILEGHNSFLTHLDWSDDNWHIQSISGDYDLQVWNTDKMKSDKLEDARDVTWNTQSCILGYTVAGVWPTRDKGSDINAIDRSHSGELLAAGDKYGCISLHKYPCSSPKAGSHDIKHHSSHVTAVQFLYGDACVVTTGGTDAVLMQFVLEDKTSRGSYDNGSH